MHPSATSVVNVRDLMYENQCDCRRQAIHLLDLCPSKGRISRPEVCPICWFYPAGWRPKKAVALKPHFASGSRACADKLAYPSSKVSEMHNPSRRTRVSAGVTLRKPACRSSFICLANFSGSQKIPPEKLCLLVGVTIHGKSTPVLLSPEGNPLNGFNL